MQVLGISLDLGPGALPTELETLVRAVRVAIDVGRDVELRRVRVAAQEQMKFPTGDELRSAIEQLPQGDESSPSYRARQHLEARDQFTEESGRFPSELWWDYLYRRRRSDPAIGSLFNLLRSTGYDRALAASPAAWPAGTALGLDVLDPQLYGALVAERIARLAPGDVVVRELRYPFAEVVAGVGTAEKVVKTTAGVIETTATLGSRRRLKRVEADIAAATMEDQIASSSLEVEFRREQLRAARIANESAEQDLLAKRIANAQALEGLNPRLRQQALVQHAVALGELDQADSIAALEASDVAALLSFAARPPELERSYEPDLDESE
jgi:hypothetical protein